MLIINPRVHMLRQSVRTLVRVAGVKYAHLADISVILPRGAEVVHTAPMVMLFLGVKRVALPIHSTDGTCWTLIEEMTLSLEEIALFERLWETMPREEGQPKELPHPTFFAELELKAGARLN
jgi:hypothetical protein